MTKASPPCFSDRVILEVPDITWDDEEPEVAVPPVQMPNIPGLPGGIVDALCMKMLQQMSEDGPEDRPSRTDENDDTSYPVVPTCEPGMDFSEVGCTPEDVEADFERITGIKPDLVLPAGFRRSGDVAVSPAFSAVPGHLTEQSQSKKKNKYVQDMLDRGLGDILCDVDEELSRQIQSYDADSRPRTTKQKQMFAKAFYAGQEPPPEAIPKTPANVNSRSLDNPLLEPINAQEILDQLQDTQSIEVVADDQKLTRQSLGVAKHALQGLHWEVVADGVGKDLIATISFTEKAWSALQGSSEKHSFKESVDFELSDTELRVQHAGSSVLEVNLLKAVYSETAKAKIESRHRRVIVRAPFREDTVAA